MLAVGRSQAATLLSYVASVAVLIAFTPAATFAHGAGLDSFGCHHNRKAGSYHCHRGASADRAFGSKAEMLQQLKVQQPATAPATATRSPASRTHTVIRVVDGDTVVLDGRERVRLIGVYTPETMHPTKPVEYFGKQASAFTRRMVEGKRVRLKCDQANAHLRHKDRYGRTLAYVFL